MKPTIEGVTLSQRSSIGATYMVTPGFSPEKNESDKLLVQLLKTITHTIEKRQKEGITHL